MTDDEYIAASDLAKLRLSEHALCSMHVSKYPGLTQAIRILGKIEKKLAAKVDKLARSSDE